MWVCGRHGTEDGGVGDRGQLVETQRWRTEDGDTEAGRDMKTMKIEDGDAKVARCARSRAIDTKIRRCEDSQDSQDTKMRR